jgi:thioredoxin 1
MMGKTRVVEWNDFETVVLKSDKPILVDFWAEWCVPCKAVAPVIDQLALEYKGKMTFAKVDVERNPQMASYLGIRSIPTMIVFSQGEEMERLVGNFPKSHIQKRIEHYAGK